MTSISDFQLRCLLDDDAGGGDLTTDALGIGGQLGRIEFFARQPMTVCCTEEAARMFELAGAQSAAPCASGAAVPAGTPLLRATGDAASLHRAWKATQILVEWASGIASAAATIVAAAGEVPVACTRKNAPGTKALSIKAVRSGGAIVHRLGLSETLLVFAEHRMFLDEPPAQTIARLKRRQPEKKIVVEVGSVAEARLWAEAGADVLQLEKFSPEQIAETRTATADQPEGRRTPRSGGPEQGEGWGAAPHFRVVLAAAGGINAGNAAAYARAGADLLVTSAPYSAPPRDVQVSFGSAP